MEGIRPRRFDESVDRFKISFRNTGKSPALIKTMRWDADTFTDVIRQFPVPFGREIMSPLVGPGERQAAYTLFNEAWEIEAKPKVLSGERKMIVHYAIEYEDLDGERYVFRTIFVVDQNGPRGMTQKEQGWN
jgi:hypothetical protein